MTKLTCLQCKKVLRADDTGADSPVKCPDCGQELTIPYTDAEPPPTENQEPGHPVPRKKRRRRFRAKNSEAARGKALVILICCLVVGMHLVGLIWILAGANPVASTEHRTHEISQQSEQDFGKSMGGKETEAPRRPRRMRNFMWNLGILCLMAVLLTFLYFRNNWARVVLGVLFLFSVGLGFFGICTGVFAFGLFTAGVPVLAVLELLARIGFNLGIGLMLMTSRSIAAYTDGLHPMDDGL